MGLNMKLSRLYMLYDTVTVALVSAAACFTIPMEWGHKGKHIFVTFFDLNCWLLLLRYCLFAPA